MQRTFASVQEIVQHLQQNLTTDQRAFLVQEGVMVQVGTGWLISDVVSLCAQLPVLEEKRAQCVLTPVSQFDDVMMNLDALLDGGGK